MTSLFRSFRACCVLGVTACFLWPQAGLCQPAVAVQGQHDGTHDFDFENGSWKIHLRRLDHPLTGSHTWIEFDGTSVTRGIWNGGAQVERFETSGAGGSIEGLTLRLYNPVSREWSLYWSNSKDGTIDRPMVGAFKDGQGEFYDQEPYHGRMIFVRFVWSHITPDTAHFEQSFSEDGGRTWEVNWITDQTRVGPAEPFGDAQAQGR